MCDEYTRLLCAVVFVKLGLSLCIERQLTVSCVYVCTRLPCASFHSVLALLYVFVEFQLSSSEVML